MSADYEAALQFAHRANIARYRKLLTTFLSEHERQFVKRRLAEEEAALQQIAKRIVSVDQAID